jgi:hypothetical protein
MTRAHIVRLRTIRSCIWIIQGAEDALWLMLAGNHGWAHGEKESAEADASWLAENLGLPIRSAA